MGVFLGIDTSNYTTSAALYDSVSGSMLQKKQLLPVKKGQLGLRQSDAVFHHTAQLHGLISQLMDEAEANVEITAVAASSRPRPIDGSYMPCFSVGVNTGASVASVLRVPFYTFSHQEGHISAVCYGSGHPELLNTDFIAFHVSGGTTEAVLASGFGTGFKAGITARTLDLNAGQAIDRVGLMLGLQFPCGAQLERLADKYDGEPIKVKPTLKGCDCCLSGLENQCENLLKNGFAPEYIAAYCLEYVKQTLALMTERLLQKHGNLPLLYAGGVMSNKAIKEYFTAQFGAYFAPPEYSADNAAGIAFLCGNKYIHEV